MAGGSTMISKAMAAVDFCYNIRDLRGYTIDRLIKQK